MFITLTFLLTACIAKENTAAPERKIPVGPGPEDMVIDRSTGEARLLVSCTARREGEATFGEIVSYVPSSGKIDTLVRTGMPDTLNFQPHGIFLDSLHVPALLFTISHENDEGFHPVYIWEVNGDTLLFRDLAYSDKLNSPNALTLGRNGEIYIVNDSGKRGSIMEKALKLRRANIVRMIKTSSGEWDAVIVADKLSYPAGINRLGDTLFVGDAVQHELHVYSIENGLLVKLDPVKHLKGNDNIRIRDGRLYIAGHVKPFKFIAHTKSSENLSPVEVWEVDPQSGNIRSLYYTDGSAISAGSTALLCEGKLYICQVFDPYILEVDLGSIKN